MFAGAGMKGSTAASWKRNGNRLRGKTVEWLMTRIWLAMACGLLWADGSGLAGAWRGESWCGGGAPACRDEKVVYYVKDVADRPEVVVIQADKIVDGKAVTMGTGEWQYDRARHTLEWRMPRQVWLLKISGDRMEGTLTLADGTVIRKMTLTREK
jgi:hypothetical protein